MLQSLINALIGGTVAVLIVTALVLDGWYATEPSVPVWVVGHDLAVGQRLDEMDALFAGKHHLEILAPPLALSRAQLHG
jgi:type IV secretory pathway TrbD component